MANEWNKTAFVEFETMLRRHLRSGASPVAACAGFDLDAASAYLEGALGGPHLASYESHLAGCAICRRHLIELARLAQTAPGFQAQPTAEPVRIPARDRLKKTVAGWFDLSTWNLKWQIAGATSVAFAILIAALSFYKASNRAAIVVSKASTTSSIANTESGVQLDQSPTPEPSTLFADAVAEESNAIHSVWSRAPVPTPPVGPKDNAPYVTIPAPVESLAPLSVPSGAPVMAKLSGGEAGQSPPPQPRNFLTLPPLEPAVRPIERASQVNVPAPVESLEALSVPSGAPVVAKQRGDEAGQRPPLQSRNFLQLNELTRTGESGFGDFGGDSGQSAANVPAQDPRDMSRYQPKLIGGRPESRLNAPPDKRSRLRMPEIKLWSLPEIWRRTFGPLSKSDSGTESERKAKPDKQEASDDGTPKPMMVMIRGKVFDFKKGMLTDREYKPEMQKWNVWTLKQGSEQYKRALAAEPLLKEFFDQAPILIVWGNRIYKVLK